MRTYLFTARDKMNKTSIFIYKINKGLNPKQISDLAYDKLKNLLAKEVNVTPDSFVIKRGINGKPFITFFETYMNCQENHIKVLQNPNYHLSDEELNIIDYYCSEIKFNISHSDEYIAIAYGEGEVGIDIQKIKPVKDAVVKKVLPEGLILKILGSENLDDAFIQEFTILEAYLKCLGTGFNNYKKEEYLLGLKDKYLFTFKYDDYYISLINDDIALIDYYIIDENDEIIFTKCNAVNKKC